MSRVLDEAFDYPQSKEENATALLAGGIIQHGYQCGQIWGASLAAGAQAHRVCGPGPEAEIKAIQASGKVLETFRTLNKHSDCLEITDIDKSSSNWEMLWFFFFKGGTIQCFSRAAKFAPYAYRDITKTMSENDADVPESPVSCTAILAEKMGLTDYQKSMVSGFAGGIGLSGGACGALGAAIWIKNLKPDGDKSNKMDFKDPESLAIIDRFIKHTDYEFECKKIAGQIFGNVQEHADYLKAGGCSKLLDILAES